MQSTEMKTLNVSVLQKKTPYVKHVAGKLSFKTLTAAPSHLFEKTFNELLSLYIKHSVNNHVRQWLRLIKKENNHLIV